MSTGFAAEVLLVGLVGLAALLANRITQRLLIPAPALVLIGSAVAVAAVPGLDRPSQHAVDHVVTVALILVLFDGGMHIGWSRFSRALKPILTVGVGGTFLTAAGATAVAHWLIGLDWYSAVLVATAIAPTDPAVVFSVLGKREIEGNTGTILEGESGANDPVGIALMASLLSAGQLSGGATGQVLGEFALQMLVGAAIGIVGGRLITEFISRVTLPSPALHPVRTLACAFVLFGLAALLHGSGFLAVFVAGILIGDSELPYGREIEHVHSAAATLGEIVAFVALGLTVRLSELTHPGVWLAGLGLALVVTLLVRPALVGLCLVRSGLQRNERLFVVLAGLKGAVPILLGTFLFNADLPNAERLYGLVVIAVVFSVLIQGSTVPALARLLRIRMRTVELEPWTFGVRLQDEPAGRRELVVGSDLAGRSVSELASSPFDLWISVLIRNGRLVPLTAETVVEKGDRLLTTQLEE